MKQKEWILCSAIHFNDGKKYDHQPVNITEGFVICGRRHHNCYNTLAAIGKATGLKETLKSLIDKADRDVQGFLTNLDRFVNRKEACKIALEADQIVRMKPNKELDEHFGVIEEPILISEQLYDDLFSEDLY